MRKELDEKLCEKYPKMFVNRHGNMQTTAMCWGFECGDGWYNLLDTLCGTIQSYIDNNSHPGREIPQVVVEQVKEKFGTLRFYYQGGNEMITGMTWLAESMSGRICEDCGSIGQRRGGGWVKTLCDAHARPEDIMEEEHVNHD